MVLTTAFCAYNKTTKIQPTTYNNNPSEQQQLLQRTWDVDQAEVIQAQDRLVAMDLAQ